jgi:hypothetical protein
MILVGYVSSISLTLLTYAGRRAVWSNIAKYYQCLPIRRGPVIRHGFLAEFV